MTGYESKKAAAQDKIQMTNTEAMQQALEALEKSKAFVWAASCAEFVKGWGKQLDDTHKAIAALRQALEQPADEPVAWMHKQGNHEEPSFRQLDDEEISRGWAQYPLYTHPPKREWSDGEFIAEAKRRGFFANAAYGIKGET